MTGEEAYWAGLDQDQEKETDAELALRNMRSHQWVGGTDRIRPSHEWIRYCKVCGLEDTCEDPLPPCPAVKEIKQ